MITHMCQSPSLGINAFIDQQLSYIKYSSFESVVDITAGLDRVKIQVNLTLNCYQVTFNLSWEL